MTERDTRWFGGSPPPGPKETPPPESPIKTPAEPEEPEEDAPEPEKKDK